MQRPNPQRREKEPGKIGNHKPRYLNPEQIANPKFQVQKILAWRIGISNICA
jgi:hypothetical protein